MGVLSGADSTPQSREVYCEQIASLIRRGQPAAAFEQAREAIAHYPADARLEYLHALSLARGGNPSHADKIVKQVLRRSDLAPAIRTDALSLSARLYKDRYASASGKAARKAHARKSAELYLMAYKISRDAFPGINAATMMRIAGGNAEQVKALAREIKATVSKQLEGSEDPFWKLATLGEACLLLGECGGRGDDENCAEYWYRRAVEVAGTDSQGDIAAMRRQVHLLQAYTDVPDALLEALAGGIIAVFSGHMIDRPDRSASGDRPRFPPDKRLEASVAQALADTIDTLDIREGFVSLACGADILFAEQLAEAGRRVHVVLPFALEDFIRRSVDFGWQDEYWQGWRARCEKVLEYAGEDVRFASTEHDYGGDIMFRFLNQFKQGLAIQRASRLDLDAWAVLVSEQSDSAVQGGTSDFAAEWMAKGTPHSERVHHIDLRALREKAVPDADAVTDSQDGSAGSLEAPAFSGALGLFGAEDMEIRSMLFADVCGFSALREDQANIFFIYFAEKVAQLIEDFPAQPIFQNSWGDGLFFAFRKAADCAEFALELVDIPNSTDFESLGLPADLSIRVGIHTGPVFVLDDPIIGHKNNFGAHVNRAARIEPVTIPGCVYASEHMAAILAGTTDRRFILEYVGVADLAKGYDRCPLYQVEKV